MTSTPLLPERRGTVTPQASNDFVEVIHVGSVGGPPGPQGPAGTPGEPGAPGSKWLSGTGPPASGLGAVGDWYMDTSLGSIWEKTAATTWSARGTLRGPTGPAGPVETTQVIEAVVAASYTIVTADAGKLKRLTGVGAITVTLPAAALGIGQRVDFACIGGVATFVLSGATWDVAPTPSAVARSIGSFVTAIKMSASTFALTGDLA